MAGLRKHRPVPRDLHEQCERANERRRAEEALARRRPELLAEMEASWGRPAP